MPVEPMYMPGRLRTGSSPFEDRDVLCRIGPARLGFSGGNGSLLSRGFSP